MRTARPTPSPTPRTGRPLPPPLEICATCGQFARGFGKGYTDAHGQRSSLAFCSMDCLTLAAKTETKEKLVSLIQQADDHAPERVAKTLLQAFPELADWPDDKLVELAVEADEAWKRARHHIADRLLERQERRAM